MAGELTRHREQDDLLVRPFFRGIVVDRYAAGGDLALIFRPWDVPLFMHGDNK